jgi:hypothetical protein
VDTSPEANKMTDWRSIPGPWQGEPDREEWRHDGVPCLVVRNVRQGHWCGYAGVPPGHPWHGLHYSKLDDVEIHGGLTYAAPCSGHICHVPQPGESENVWWLGFDCWHFADLAPFELTLEMLQPGLKAERLRAGTGYPFEREYKTLAWVKAETQRLADQVVAAR